MKKVLKRIVSILMCIILAFPGMSMNVSATTLKITSQPQDVSVAVGEAMSFSVTAEGTDLSYQWYYHKADVSSWSKLTWTGNTSTTVYANAGITQNGMQLYCLVTDGDGNSVESDVATITITDGTAKITSQPVDVSAVEDESVVFTVGVTSDDELSYQWQQLKTDEGSDWVSISSYDGCKTASMTVTAYSSRNGYQYRCIVKESSGFYVVSEAATLTVTEKLAINTQPEDISAATGDTVTFAVAAQGTGITCQWYYKNAGESEWTLWSGETSETLSFVAAASQNGLRVFCRVTSQSGAYVDSSVAMLMLDGTLAIISQPESCEVTSGDTVTFTVLATGENLSYQWYYMKTTADSWTLWSGHTAATTSATTNATWNGIQIYCVVTDGSGESISSDIATVTMTDATLQIVDQPADVSAVVNSDAVFTVSADGTDLTYQWQQLKTDEGSSWVSISSYDGCLTDTLTVTAYTSRSGYQYRCIVTDGDGFVVVSNAAVLTVTAGTSITTDVTDCTADLASTAVLSLEAEGTDLTYTWQIRNSSLSWVWTEVSDANLDELTGENSDTITFYAAAPLEDSQFRCIVVDAYGNKATSSTVTLQLTIGECTTVEATDFGADGTDTESDRSTIQKALNFALSHATEEVPITVHLSGGTYYISDGSLVIYSNTTFLLDDDTVLMYAIEDEAGCLLQGGDETQTSYETLVNVTIEGGVWDGNAAEYAAENNMTTELIGLKAGSNITIRNMTLTNCTDHCVMLTGISNAVVTGCTFTDYVARSSETGITDEYTREALHLDFLPIDDVMFPTQYVTVSDCKFTNLASAIGTHNTSEDTVEDGIVIRNCTFTDIVYDCVNAYCMTNLEVSNCTAYNCGSFLRGNSAEGTISNNEISVMGERGIRLYSGSDFYIGYNTIDGVGTSSYEWDDTDAIAIAAYGADCEIEGNAITNTNGIAVRATTDAILIARSNTIKAATAYGIFFTGAEATIEENELLSVGGYAVFLGGNGTALVQNNTIMSEGDYGIYVGAADVVIQYNEVSGAAVDGICLVVVNEDNITYASTGEVIYNTISDSGVNDIRVGRGCGDCLIAYNNLASDITLEISVVSGAVVYDNGLNPRVAAPEVSASSTGNTVLLSWDEVEGASYYRIFSIDMVDPDDPSTYTWTGIKKIEAGEPTEYRVTNLETDTEYVFIVLSYEEDDTYCIYTWQANLVYASTQAEDDGLAITAQPEDITVLMNCSAVFTVEAEGYGELSYQWQQLKTSSDSIWTSISSYEGCQTDTLTVVAYTDRDGYQYRCVVTDEYGNTVTSEAAVLTVSQEFTIYGQPESVTADEGDTVVFEVKAAGVGLQYQWYYKKAGATEWTIWKGHTSAKTSGQANGTWEGMQVYCVVTDSNGNILESDVATISLTKITLAITSQPESIDAAVGDYVAFSVEATGTGLTYQWYYMKADATEWTLWKGHTTAETYATVGSSWNGIQLYCLITDAYGDTISSDAATVTLTDTLEITGQPESVAVTTGSSVSFTVTASGTGLKYQWYYKKAGATSWSKWSGHTTATTTATANSSWNGMQVYCIVTDAIGNSLSSDPATITLTDTLEITGQPESVAVLTGTTVSFTVTASGTGLKYQWYYKKAGVTSWSKWSGHTTATTTAAANSSWNGMQVYCIVTDALGNSLSSDPATITLTDTLEITEQPQNVEAETGASVTFSVTASGTGLKYQWYYKKVGAAEWSKWTGHTTAATTATANSTWNGIQIYCVVTDALGNSVSSSIATVTLTDVLEITAQSGDFTIAVGDTATFSVSVNGTGLKYQWYYRKAGATTWSKWNSHTTATTTATAGSTWNGMQVYCVVTDAYGNTVESEPVMVSLEGVFAIVAQPEDVTVSSGENVSFTVKATGEGLNYQWYYKKAGASSWSIWNGHTAATTMATANSTWNGMQVYCVVTDENGNALSSEVATITLA